MRCLWSSHASDAAAAAASGQPMIAGAVASSGNGRQCSATRAAVRWRRGARLSAMGSENSFDNVRDSRVFGRGAVA